MERVKIGKNYPKQPIWKLYLGVSLIYFPLFIKIHLKYVGAEDIRSYWDFVPD